MDPVSSHYPVVIIGSGPSGLTAAIYLARANLSPVIFSGPEPGGQLMTTTDVGNFPGFEEEIMGPELMRRMRAQAAKYGTSFIEEKITDVDFSKKPFSLTSDRQTVTADSVIIATGASARWLGIESEQRLRGKGVSACATCDGFFFKGKDIAVIGGGDSAMEEATFLTKFANHVTLIHRKPEFNASKIMQERARQNPKISFIVDSEVAEILGTQTVEGIKIKNSKTGVEKVVPVQGVFLAIGHTPNTHFLEGKIALTKGYVQVIDNTKTSVEGVFAAGDVQDWRYRQAITAAGLGCMAALDVEKYLAARE